MENSPEIYDALRSFEQKSANDFKTKMGTIKFKYNETYKNSRYNMSDAEEMRPYDEVEYNGGSIFGNMLLMTASRNYTLPANYYQYIRKKDSLSVKTKPSNTSQYINLGFSNLPISFENKGDADGKAADIQFSFELPTNDGYSKLNKAYIKDNSYLRTENSNGNIYKKYKTNKMGSGDQELLNNSACAKMFGMNTVGFENCVSHRTGNAIGDGSYNCITQNQQSLTGSVTKGYSCMVLINTPDNPDPVCDTEEEAKNQGLDWNPVGKYCCPPGTKYNSKTGKCGPDKTTGECDTEEEAKNQGLDWNPVGKYCCPAGTKYNSKTGECDRDQTTGSCNSEEEAKKQKRDWNPAGKYCCPVDTTYNPSTKKCEDPGDNDNCDSETAATDQGRDWNPTTNKCCPKGTIYNPSTGKCDDGGGGDNVCRIENGKYYDFNGNQITKDEYDILCPSDVPYYCPNDCQYGCCPSGECAPMPTINGEPYCPGPGGLDVIYRTIDLEDPFPGQNAENRETGANWCSYNIRTQQFSCAYNNTTVKEYITRERNSVKNGNKVYDENHVLYEVTLDSATIEKVRKYNDKNQYDDWDLKCLNNGKACISDFLKSEVKTTGKCVNASKSNFYSCDKDV